MAIYKKGDKYVPIVYYGKDPLTKKEIRKWGHYWEKRADAKKEHTQMELEKDNSSISAIFKDPTFDALAEQFFSAVAPAKYANSTLDMYTGYYNKHIKPTFKGRLLKEIEPIHIQRFMQTKNELAPESQRKIFYFLKSIFDSGAKWGWIKINPCIGTELPTIKKDKNKEIWVPEQIANFLGSKIVQDSKYYIMLLVSFSTGMRPGEVCGLRWEDITEDRITVTTGIDKKRRATDLKTNSSYREIYIDKKLYQKLIVQQRWQKENRLFFGEKYNISNYAFTHEDGSLIGPYRYGVSFQNLIKQINKNSYGEYVSQLQAILKKLGYFTGDIDGAFGSTTTAAVEKFQSDNGIKKDGIVAQSTWELLKITPSDDLPTLKEYLPKLSIYGARHSFASNAIASGIEPSIVAEILGHSTISTTYDNYVHVKPEPIRAAFTQVYNSITH